ncbi:elongation factor Ts [Chloroflexota bacterium]
MEIPTSRVKELREHSKAGVMECRNALIEAEGDMEKALGILKERSLIKVEKKRGHSASEGLIETYVHAGGRIGAMVEVNCETDFAARTDEFKELAHNLAMQVAAIPPKFIAMEEVPKGSDIEAKADCLLVQPYIRNPDITVQDFINEAIAKVGENIKVSRFARFELGE